MGNEFNLENLGNPPPYEEVAFDDFGINQKNVDDFGINQKNIDDSNNNK